VEIENKKRRLWPWVLTAVVLGIAAGLAVFWWMSYLTADDVKAPAGEASEEEAPEASVVSVEGKMLLTGNIFWGRKINTAARASEIGVDFAFSGLAEFGREGYTDWIGGLECPVTDRGQNKYEQEQLLKFNCDPDYLPSFAKWFSAVSLGTNHTGDQGADGFAETKKWLGEAGIGYFGHYDYKDTEEVCGVVGVKVIEKMSDGSEVEKVLPMGFCGWNGVFGAPTEASLLRIKEFAEVMPVVAMPHMGVEYKPASDSLRERIYRKMIDYGAEFVAGDHPHWVQNAEVYQGKLIVYAMGNFLFDQVWDLDVRRSAAIAAGFAVSGAEGWEEIAEECVRGGLLVCKGLAEEGGLAKYEVKWDFDVVGTLMGKDFVLRKADEGVTQGILGRLRWGEVKTGLQG